MSDPENFLARWSRRKRETTEDDAENKSALPAAQSAGDASAGDDDQKDAHAAAALPDRPEAIEPPFDLTHLPPLESITAETDIRAFLAPGVPSHLTRAALRRVWAADPKIRDFVGLADYDWDYHAPGSMAGFGPLEMTDELRRLVTRIIGGDVSEDATPGPELAPAGASDTAIPAQTSIESVDTVASTTGLSSQVDAKQLEIPQEDAAKYNQEPQRHKELTQYDQDHVAPQHELESPDNLPSIVRRLHGRALPK